MRESGAEQTYAQDAILSVEEAAKYLRASTPTVRAYCHLDEGQPDRLPNFRLGTAIRIPFWGLLLWISRRAGCELPPAPTKAEPSRRMMRKPAPRRTTLQRRSRDG